MRLRLKVMTAGLIALGMGASGVGAASAVPRSVEPNLVRTLRCDVPDPWPGPPLRTHVDVFNQVAYPSDGLPGPVITLIATNPRLQGGTAGFLEYTSETTVTWRNLTTGRSGRIVVPTRARANTWEVNIHSGKGRVAFTIGQKIGAMAFVPMVNPQFSTCRGTASAV
ncbi:hypothetical protein [Gordonia sp. CPCC 205333]|uniref:hypothetical protein n=1 Tax=Gordonia sp. CPCC 205333 TaxID=3140790 RepID=UPI003AF36838